MNSVPYVTVQQFCAFHHCEPVIIEEFIEYGILEISPAQNDIVLIPEDEVPKLEKALRLREELGVNAAGIDIILRLLERVPKR